MVRLIDSSFLPDEPTPWLGTPRGHIVASEAGDRKGYFVRRPMREIRGRRSEGGREVGGREVTEVTAKPYSEKQRDYESGPSRISSF
jgi:hypothetical protein